jgi:hypothetical protein
MLLLFLFIYISLFISLFLAVCFPFCFSFLNLTVFKNSSNMNLPCLKCKLPPDSRVLSTSVYECIVALDNRTYFYTVGRPPSCVQEVGRVTRAIVCLVRLNIWSRSVYPLADVDDTMYFACGYTTSCGWLMNRRTVPSGIMWWLQACNSADCCVVVTDLLYRQ